MAFLLGPSPCQAWPPAPAASAAPAAPRSCKQHGPNPVHSTAQADLNASQASTYQRSIKKYPLIWPQVPTPVPPPPFPPIPRRLPPPSNLPRQPAGGPPKPPLKHPTGTNSPLNTQDPPPHTLPLTRHRLARSMRPNPSGSLRAAPCAVTATAAGCHTTASRDLSSVGAVDATLLINLSTVADSCSRSTSWCGLLRVCGLGGGCGGCGVCGG